MAHGLVQVLCEFYELLASNSRFCGDAAKARIREVGRLLTPMYSKLSKYSFDAGLRLYKMSPNMHLFLHLCEDQIPVYGNAHFYLTYSDEDLVGQLVKLAKGLHPNTLVISLLTKMALFGF